MKKGDLVKIKNDPDWLKLQVIEVDEKDAVLGAPNSGLPGIWVPVESVEAFKPRPEPL